MTGDALASFGQGNDPESILKACASDHEPD